MTPGAWLVYEHCSHIIRRENPSIHLLAANKNTAVVIVVSCTCLCLSCASEIAERAKQKQCQLHTISTTNIEGIIVKCIKLLHAQAATSLEAVL